MFERIPAKVLDVLENNDLLVYSCMLKLSKSGPVLHVGAMFPYRKNRWEPLDDEENRELRIDVKKELARLGWKSKVRSFVDPQTGEKDINDFRIRILLRKRDVEPEVLAALKKVRSDLRRAKKQARLRARLAGQL